MTSEPSTTPKKKLSALLREGIALNPNQAFGDYYDHMTGGTCALGAIFQAITKERPRTYEEDPEHRHTYLGVIEQATGIRKYDCIPIMKNALVYDEIVHLNDNLNYSREVIAEMLDSWGL